MNGKVWDIFNKAQSEKVDVNTFPNLNVNQSLRITLTLNKLGHLEFWMIKLLLFPKVPRYMVKRGRIVIPDSFIDRQTPTDVEIM